MTATLSTIDTALFAALALGQHTGTPTSDAPFALVGRYAGEVNEAGITDAAAQFPSAFLRYDGGASTRTVDAVEGTEDAGLESWTVLVCLEEPRAVDEAVQGSSPLTPGFLPLIERVLELCNGLVFDGAFRDRRVRVADYGRPVLVKRGVLYVYSVRFECRRPLPSVALTTAQASNGQALTAIAGDVNLTGTDDTAPNPLVSLIETY
jgi:hypothetical protein